MVLTDRVTCGVIGFCPRAALFRQDGQTPLHTAVKEGHVEVVKSLLRANANPNAADQVCPSESFVTVHWRMCRWR
jgi:hypothetical protein